MKHENSGDTGSCRRSVCPIANILDIMGDKWTLLILRDLLGGKIRYGQLIESPEGISSNILADRLQRMEAQELIHKVPYQSHPRRYEYHLTSRGRDMRPILSEMVKWASKHIPGVALFAEHNADQ